MITQLTMDVVRRWLDAYILAWQSYDAEAIGALFTTDVRYEPEPWVLIEGRDAVVDAWLDDRDPPGSWRAFYEPVAIDGWLSVATGTTGYVDVSGDDPHATEVGGVTRRAAQTVYHNVFLLEFDPDQRCRHYREWFMREQ
jgi:hypothetical protein